MYTVPCIILTCVRFIILSATSALLVLYYVQAIGAINIKRVEYTERHVSLVLLL